MADQYRRVLTGHTPERKSTVLFDSRLPLAEPAKVKSRDAEIDRHGTASSVSWLTQGFPSDNSGSSDDRLRKVPTALGDGTVLRLVQYSPGVTPRHHRTNSVDYAIVLSGCIELEPGAEPVKLNTGDVLVQRKTIHNWINNGADPCLMACVLIGAKPVTLQNGMTLQAQG